MGPAGEILKGHELRNIIMLQFFKKPMANKCPNMAKSGLSEGTKKSSASQEVLRRLKNTSRELPPKVIKEILIDYMGELAMGGYSII